MNSTNHTDQETRFYHKSFATYRVPLSLKDPMPFHETEGVTSYYIGIYNQEGRVRRVTKVLLQRRDQKSVQLVAPKPPHSDVLFAVEVDGEGIRNVGSELQYGDTESLQMYWRGDVNDAGLFADVELVERTAFFEEAYAYWDNGSLKRRVVSKADGSRTIWEYDESGQSIEHRVVPGPR